MKLLAVAAFLVAGSIAVPTNSYPPPPPTYGDDPSGEVGYPPEYPPDYAPQQPEKPPAHGGYGDVPSDGDEYGYPPSSSTTLPSYPPPPAYTGPSYTDPSYTGPSSAGPSSAGPSSAGHSTSTVSPSPAPTNGGGDGDGDGDDVPGSPEQPPTDGDSNPPDDGDNGDDTVGGGDDGDGEDGSSDLCAPLLYSNPQCCDASVLGVLDLNCAPPSRTPDDYSDFNVICEETGQKAQCCVLPLLGQGVLCEDVPLQ